MEKSLAPAWFVQASIEWEEAKSGQANARSNCAP